MNIAVIAANGRSGQAFVRAALTNDHHVRAGVHSYNPFSEEATLTVIRCDATSASDIAKLIEGCDAVVSLIGHVKGSKPDVQTAAITNIIAAMQHTKITRLISLTGTGVRFPGDKITFIDRILNMGVRIVDPSRMRDGQNHVTAIAASDLEWTIIRVLKLQNVKSRHYTLREHGPTRLYVGRDEVAQAILEVLENHSFVRQAPIIAR